MSAPTHKPGTQRHRHRGVVTIGFTLVELLIVIAIILIIGWLIAGALAAGVAALLRAVKFNVLAQRSGLQGFIHNMGLRTDPSGLLADIVKWFVRLIVLPIE